LFVVLVGWTTPAQAQSATRGLSADRYDVQLTLLQDGSIDVKETVVFHFQEKKFSEVDRQLSLEHVDGIIDIRASMDGQPLVEGQGVRVRNGRRSVRITWKFPDTINQRRTFTLEYRAMGALSVENGRARLAWPVLPSRHRYVIGQARVEWRVPNSVVRRIPTTLDDPRWVSTALSDGWAADRSLVGVDETVWLTDEFDLSSLATSVPTWQTNQFRASQMAPAFVVSALTLFVTALGIVAMTLFRYHRSPRDRSSEYDRLAPALGTSLLSNTVRISMAQVQAALVELMRRGVLQIRQTANAVNPKKADAYEVVMSQPGQVQPHERPLTDVLWLHMKNGVISLAEARTHLTKAFPAFRKAVLAELTEAGLIDQERRSAVRAMTIAGAVVMAVGFAGVALFAVLFGHLGDLPLLVPGAVAVAGVIFLITAQGMAVVSDAGLSAAESWRHKQRELKARVRSGERLQVTEADWATAAGAGLAPQLLKAAGQGPAWLSHLADPSAAMTVVMATVVVHGAGGAGGGGSVGGGGSSGAH
jgi:hypothetical protein